MVDLLFNSVNILGEKNIDYSKSKRFLQLPFWMCDACKQKSVVKSSFHANSPKEIYFYENFLDLCKARSCD